MYGTVADISLRWMVKQVILSQCRAKFDVIALRKANINIQLSFLLVPHSRLLSRSGGRSLKPRPMFLRQLRQAQLEKMVVGAT